MLNSFKRALVLAPHTDDGELGAGGTIAKLVDAGVEVFYAAFSTAEQSVPAGLPKDILQKEVRAATTQLGIKNNNLIIYNYEVRKLNFFRQEILENLIELRRDIQPDLVLMPSLQDVHQDHATVSQEGLRAFKSTTLLGYELVWNNLDFRTSLFVSLSSSCLEKKYQALREYESQAAKTYMSREFIFSLAKVRGVQIGKEYAESFEVVRWLID